MAFRALVAEKTDGGTSVSLRQLARDEFTEGDVWVSVAYSSLNYKDALAVTGQGKIIRRFPMVPGIDLAGTVLESQVPRWHKGDKVILTGFGLSEVHHGGYAELARVAGDKLVALPDGMSLKQAMAFGTAGLTAMLAAIALEEHGASPQGLPVLVTGAGGGLGSIAVAVLANLGYPVVASTGRAELGPYLRELGAREIVGREAVTEPAGALISERWGGAVDAVGGETLAGLLRGVARGGCVAVCGNAGGSQFATTVFPLILRGVTLAGIDSGECPLPRRIAAWGRLAQLPGEVVDRVASREVSLDEVPAASREVLAGTVRGRIVVAVG